MATSPNYAWAEPDNSSLVKNGASDIRTLGDAIDTSVWNVGFGQAGKNKLINGDFFVNQRAFSSTTTSAAFMFDRWSNANGGGTTTFTAQTFTVGTAPVAGYEGKNFLRTVTSGQSGVNDLALISQRIEGVRTLAGQTATVSFWAKAGTGTPKIGATFLQLFGTGGSPSGAVTVNGQSATISTSWARYSFTFSIPSISGKTLGTAGDDSLQFEIWVSAGSTFATRSGTVGIQNGTFDVWGVQVEYGSKATPFQTATGTIQGELAACQRYYFRWGGEQTQQFFGTVIKTTATAAQWVLQSPVQMRTKPSSVEYSTLAISNGAGSGAVTALTIGWNASPATRLDITNNSFGVGDTPATIFSNASTSGYIALNAEL